MQGQWVLDRLLRAGGLDVLWPDVVGTLLEMGFHPVDIQRTMGEVGSLAAMPPAWYRLGRWHEQRAHREREAGHHVTAAELYHRAVGCFARARWGMTGATAMEVYDRLNAAYDHVIALGTGRISRVEVPVGDGSVPGLLHLPPEASPATPVPAVLLYPGMDMTKEYLPVPGRDIFTARGLAVLSIDPPGHGYSALRGPLLDVDNAEAAGRHAIDLLTQREDIDGSRIGVFGVSLGSYFAASLASQEERISAAVSFEGGVFYDKVRFVTESQPTFGRQLARMTGLEGDALHALLSQMTMAGREHQIKCPYLIATGEWDELCPLVDVNRLFERLGGPKRLVVYEGENHVLGNVIQEALRDCVDWLADRLAGESCEAVQLVRVPRV
jgi:dipeptidyl aminopeptidase/acylaminoacyl peptidase